MDLAHRARITLAAVVAIVAATSIVLADAVSAGGGGPLVPDLRTLAPLGSDWLALDQPKTGKQVLRLSNRIGNQGDGPLELRSAPAAPDSDCVPGQFPNGADREAIQRVYTDASPGDGAFNPEEDLSYTDYPVGCFEFHQAHGHWHLQDFSQYSLADVKTGALVAGPSKKIGFCIIDGDRAFPELPGSPDFGVYPGGDGGCGFAGQDPGTMGLSVGYADTYTYFLPGQRLEVTGVEKGIYCLVSTANPPGGASQLEESDEDNNTRRARIRINPAEGKVLDLDRHCPAP